LNPTELQPDNDNKNDNQPPNPLIEPCPPSTNDKPPPTPPTHRGRPRLSLPRVVPRRRRRRRRLKSRRVVRLLVSVGVVCFLSFGLVGFWVFWFGLGLRFDQVWSRSGVLDVGVLFGSGLGYGSGSWSWVCYLSLCVWVRTSGHGLVRVVLACLFVYVAARSSRSVVSQGIPWTRTRTRTRTRTTKEDRPTIMCCRTPPPSTAPTTPSLVAAGIRDDR